MATAENRALELAVELTKMYIPKTEVLSAENKSAGEMVSDFLKTVYKSIVDIDKG